MTGAPAFPVGGAGLHHWPNTRFVQVAWVTTDIDRAIAPLGTWLGASDFVRVADRQLTVATPDGTRLLRQNLAFGRAGAVSIELVEPIGDDGGFWSDGLTGTEFALRQHHLSIEIEGDRLAWQAFRDQAARTAPVPVEGAFKRTSFLFVDLRPVLGCYLEAIWHDPNRSVVGDQPPRSTSTTPSITRDG